VYKNYVVHPQVVMKAHQAGCAAAKQGKFNEFKHDWWEKAYLPYQNSHDPSKMSDAAIEEIAKGVKLDVAKFKVDTDSDDCKARVNGDMQELNKFRVSGTPTFFINGTHAGGMSKEQFKQIIDEKIKMVQASGTSCGDYYDKEIMGKGLHEFRSKKQSGQKG
jgi:predicted DsbA family dithiol-disulfide isomerase